MTDAKLAATVYKAPAARRPWRLDSWLGHDRLRFFSLGRWALAEALRLSGAGPGKKVLLPGYLCREVVGAVRALGAEPVYYGVAPDLSLADDPKTLPTACAVVAVNFFGFPQDLEPFREYCARTRAVLIEDNAHGLFSRDETGAALGTRAPLGIFSLRKTVPLPDGGALSINDASYLAEAFPQLPFAARPESRRRCLRMLTPLLGARGVWDCIAFSRRLRAIKNGAEIPPPDPEGENRIPGEPEPCAALNAPLTTLEPAREAARRRALYRFCAELLSGAGVRPVFSRLHDGTSPYVFAFRGPEHAAAAAESLLNARGLFSLAWPDLPEAVAPSAPAHYRDVRGVHFLW